MQQNPNLVQGNLLKLANASHMESALPSSMVYGGTLSAIEHGWDHEELKLYPYEPSNGPWTSAREIRFQIPNSIDIDFTKAWMEIEVLGSVTGAGSLNLTRAGIQQIFESYSVFINGVKKDEKLNFDDIFRLRKNLTHSSHLQWPGDELSEKVQGYFLNPTDYPVLNNIKTAKTFVCPMFIPMLANNILPWKKWTGQNEIRFRVADYNKFLNYIPADEENPANVNFSITKFVIHCESIRIPPHREAELYGSKLQIHYKDWDFYSQPVPLNTQEAVFKLYHGYNSLEMILGTNRITAALTSVKQNDSKAFAIDPNNVIGNYTKYLNKIIPQEKIMGNLELYLSAVKGLDEFSASGGFAAHSLGLYGYQWPHPSNGSPSDIGPLLVWDMRPYKEDTHICGINTTNRTDPIELHTIYGNGGSTLDSGTHFYFAIYDRLITLHPDGTVENTD